MKDKKINLKIHSLMKGERVEKGRKRGGGQEEEVKGIKKKKNTHGITLSSHYFKRFTCVSFYKLSNNIVAGRIEY